MEVLKSVILLSSDSSEKYDCLAYEHIIMF